MLLTRPAGVAAIAALVFIALLTVSSEQAAAYECKDKWKPWLPHHQGGPTRGPLCVGHGGNEGNPLHLYGGDGHKPDILTDTHNARCHNVSEWAEPHHREIHGSRFTFYYVWAKGHDYPTQPTILACSDENHHVDPFTIGPGQHGASLPCPEIDGHERQSRPIHGGLAWWLVDGHPTHATFVQGSFGHNHDGYWHYKFHNWWLDRDAETTGATLQGFCRYVPR